MKRLRKLNAGEFITVGCMAIGFSFLNLYHVFSYALVKPANTIYIGISHWYEDYFFYLSQLTQGAMGRWTLVNNYTTERIPQGVSWWFNLWLGKLTYILPIPVWTLYDATIFVLSVVYIVLMHVVLRSVFPTSPRLRLGALLVALTSTNLFYKDAGRIIPFTYFYAYTSSLNRLGGIAHHVAQDILSLAFIFLAAKLLVVANNSKLKSDLPRLVRLSIFGALILVALFIISAFYVAADLVVFGLVAGLYVFIYRKYAYILRMGLSLAILVVPILPFAFYQALALRDPFWIFVRDWEANIAPTNITTFILSSGLIVFFICFGIAPFLKKFTPLRALGLVFAALPIILYFSPLPRLLHTPSFRLLQPPAYVFLGTMAIEGLNLLSNLAKRYKRYLFSLLLALFVAVQIPVIVTEVRERVGEYFLNSPLNFVPKDIYDGLIWLRSTPLNKNVLAIHTLETLVPPVSGHTVYTGHGTLTINYAQKTQEALDFYSGPMLTQQAHDFLKKNSIGYVLWKTEDGESSMFTARYPFLKQVYKNPLIEIYSVE